MKQTRKTKIYMHPVYFEYGTDYYGNIWSFKKESKKKLKTVTLHVGSGYEMFTVVYEGEKIRQYVSRFAWECFNGCIIPKGMEIDHKNHITDQNYKSNLRLATSQQNQYNAKPQKNRSSKYKGVRYDKINKCWKAGIRVMGQWIHAGNFQDEIEAAKAYNRVAVSVAGEFSFLNEIPKGK